MGVRARVAEWPPRSKDPKDSSSSPSPSPSSSSSRNVSTPSQPLSGFKALHRLARRRSKDVEFQEGWPGRATAPLRQRSSSEVTLSECDPEEAPECR
ncbi:SI1L3 protein, partial [Erpornis zantholeuca]|nr:SI1L3 protein [Erpornis zantholeuca]